jgi:hypothetical protein
MSEQIHAKGAHVSKLNPAWVWPPSAREDEGEGPPPVEAEWELIFEEDFEGAGIPAGWAISDGATADFINTEAPISGSQSLMMDGTFPSYGAISYVRANGGLLLHKQVRLTYKIKLATVGGGYQQIAQISGSGGYVNIFVNAQNQVEIIGYTSLSMAQSTTQLEANTVYELQHVVVDSGQSPYHALSINGVEEARVPLNPNTNATFNALFFVNNWCREWLDDMKLEGIVR